jgi:wyosine [tRNA(Phe)-imidazoG37] synthetase (radical SAM superfamily)
VHHVSTSEGFERELPSTAEVTAALRDALASIPPPDYVTFSGNGEPTLHPEFPAMVEAVRAVRDASCPAAKLAVLSNSSTVGRPEIRAALASVDAAIMKLDAGSPASFGAVNVPAAGVKFDDVLEGLAALGKFTVQSCFVAGEAGNADDEAAADYVRAIAAVKPSAVQVYTTDRPVARPGVRMVPRERLAAMARRVCEEAGVPAEIY